MRRNFSTMRNRALRPFTMMLSLLLAACTTVQAGPISITDVVQVMSSYKNNAELSDLRLRNVSRYSSQSKDEPGPIATTPDSPVNEKAADISDTSLAGVLATSESLLEGIEMKGDDNPNVDVIAQGDLEGSICDCGEIPVVEHHHRKWWPLLFLAAIPFFFIHHKECTSCPPSTPTPTPTPPPEVPEPGTLLLFGSGLAAVGAGLRRRYLQGKLQKAIARTEEA